MHKTTKAWILFSLLAIAGYVHADGADVSWAIRAVCAPSFQKEFDEQRKIFKGMADDHSPHSFLDGDNFLMRSTKTQDVSSLNDVCEEKCQDEFYSDYKDWENSKELIIAVPKDGLINEYGGVFQFDPDTLVPFLISLKWIRHFCSQCPGMTTEPLPTCLVAVFENGSNHVRYQAELLSQISGWIIFKLVKIKNSKYYTWSLVKNKTAYTDEEAEQPIYDQLNNQ